MRTTAFSLWVFCVVSLCAANQRYALLVGADRGGDELAVLKYAQSDAQRFANVLKGPGEFSDGNITTLLAPDSAAIHKALNKINDVIQSKPDKNTLLLFYYSGHSDGEYLLFENDRYPLGSVKTFLDSSGADIRIGIFDACYSGAVVAFRGGRRGDPFFMASEEKVKGQVIISSSAAHERAQESETLQGSIFTHHWLNGLKGSADLDGDRYVTLNEAYRYAYHKTIETSALTGGGLQHPSYHFNIQGEGEIRLTNLNRSVLSGVLFDKSCHGAFLVLSPTFANVYADFNKKSGKETFIALAPGEYSAINGRESDVYIKHFSVSESETVYLTNSMLVNRPLVDVTRVKGPEQAEYAPATPINYDDAKLSKSIQWGLGTGVISGFWSNRGADILLSAVGVFPLEEERSLYGDLQVLPLRKKVAIGAGANVYNPVLDFDMFAGMGAALWYDHLGADRFALAVRAQTGFSRKISESMEIQAQIPFLFVFSRDIGFRTGIEMRVLFSGNRL